jgi:hypothetical protein
MFGERRPQGGALFLSPFQPPLNNLLITGKNLTIILEFTKAWDYICYGFS